MSWHILAGLIAIIVSVCSLLDWILTDKEKKPDALRLTLIGWFSRLHEFKLSEAIRASSATFNGLFDSVYGTRIFSLRRAGMSILTSVLAIAISSYVYLGWMHREPVFHEFGALLLPVFLFINLIIDFVSLNKARFILGKTEHSTAARLVLLLILDLALTVVIYSIGFFVLFLLFSGSYSGTLELLREIMDGSADYMAPVFFFAAFFTSLLFYLFLATTIIFKILDLSKTRLMILLERLDDSDNLFKTIGAILSALLAGGKGVAEIITALSPKK